MSKSYYLARDDYALRNGSFYRVHPRKRNPIFALYMNGDYMGTVQVLPVNLRRYGADEAKRLLPVVNGGRR